MRMLDRCVPPATLLGLLILCVAVPHAQNPPGGPGAPNFTLDLDAIFQERPILAQFDASKNGRLDRAERQAAREWIAKQPPFGLAAVTRNAITDSLSTAWAVVPRVEDVEPPL